MVFVFSEKIHGMSCNAEVRLVTRCMLVFFLLLQRKPCDKDSVRQTAGKVLGLSLHFSRSSRCASLVLLVAGGRAVGLFSSVLPLPFSFFFQDKWKCFCMFWDKLTCSSFQLVFVFSLRYGERACVSFFCGCKLFKITVVKNNYGCFLA